MSKRPRSDRVKTKVDYTVEMDEDDSDHDPSFDPNTQHDNTTKVARIQQILNEQSSHEMEVTLTPETIADHVPEDPNKQPDPKTSTPPARKSKFSQFFEFKTEIHGEIEKRTAKCLLCKTSKVFSMPDRVTTPLKRHMKNKHLNEFKKMFPKEVKDKDQMSIIDAFASTSSTPPLSSSKLSKPIKENALDQNLFRKATVDWITKKYLPFSFFDDEATKEYFKLICPGQQFPNRYNLTKQVQDEFNLKREVLKKKILDCKSKVSFTIDGWTSLAGKSYYGITVHFIDDNWSYESFVLDFLPSGGKHKGKDIADLFHECLKDFGLENKIQGITVDNASANTTFMEELGNRIPSFDSENQHFRCMAHILNLAVQDMLKEMLLQHQSDEESDVSDDEEERIVDNTSNCLNKLRSLIVKIKRSEQVKNQFMDMCKAAEVSTCITPTLDCPTRWNSTHDMLGVALKLKPGIQSMCALTDYKKYEIFEDEWTVIEKIHKFLMNFKKLSTILSADQYVTLPSVVVQFNLLLDNVDQHITKLQADSRRNTTDEKLLKAFIAAKTKMLKHYQKTNWIYCVSLILDPRHKIETFDKTIWGQEMKEITIQKFTEIFNEYKLTSDNKPPQLSSTSSEDSQEGIDYDQLYEKQRKSVSSQDSRKEIDCYKTLPRAPGKEDILKWWSKEEGNYPVLARMAKDFLSTPATSVSAERLFSRASLVMRKHRMRLTNESARWLLCLNSWAGKIKS